MRFLLCGMLCQCDADAHFELTDCDCGCAWRRPGSVGFARWCGEFGCVSVGFVDTRTEPPDRAEKSAPATPWPPAPPTVDARKAGAASPGTVDRRRRWRPLPGPLPPEWDRNRRYQRACCRHRAAFHR